MVHISSRCTAEIRTLLNKLVVDVSERGPGQAGQVLVGPLLCSKFTGSWQVGLDGHVHLLADVPYLALLFPELGIQPGVGKKQVRELQNVSLCQEFELMHLALQMQPDMIP